MADGDAAQTGRPGARTAWTGAGLVLILIAVLLPTAWYDHIPRNMTDVPDPPFRGVTLLRISLAVEGLTLIAIGLSGGLRIRLGNEERILMDSPREEPRSVSPLMTLSVITAIGAGLRFWRLGSDLWLDEITTVLDYRSVSTFHVIVAYVSSNNHLLNTLLIKWMTGMFGPEEWAVRFPAACFGIATIPALYLLARVALDRGTSLLACLFLAVSYHHIFFSQNARGYAALLFFAVLGTAFLLRALRDDRTSDWTLYVITMFLAVASLLHGFFVLAGHGVVILAVAATRLREGKATYRLLLKTVAMWGFVCALALDLYACIVPQVYSYLGVVYKSKAAGYSPYSSEAVRETLRGIAAGFGGGAAIAAILVLAIIGTGFLRFVRRQPIYALALAAPLLTTGGFVLLRNLAFSPRFFVWGIPAGMIFVAVAVRELCMAAPLRWARVVRWVPIAAAVAFVTVSAYSLAYYYRTPKQPSRQVASYLADQRREGDLVVAAFLAKWSLRFYGPQYGMVEGRDFVVAESENALRAVEAESGGRRIWLLRTLPRALRLEFPQLASDIESTCLTEKSFPATLGDGGFDVMTCRGGSRR